MISIKRTEAMTTVSKEELAIEETEVDVAAIKEEVKEEEAMREDVVLMRSIVEGTTDYYGLHF